MGMSSTANLGGRPKKTIKKKMPVRVPTQVSVCSHPGLECLLAAGALYCRRCFCGASMAILPHGNFTSVESVQIVLVETSWRKSPNGAAHFPTKVRLYLAFVSQQCPATPGMGTRTHAQCDTTCTYLCGQGACLALPHTPPTLGSASRVISPPTDAFL